MGGGGGGLGFRLQAFPEFGEWSFNGVYLAEGCELESSAFEAPVLVFLSLFGWRLAPWKIQPSRAHPTSTESPPDPEALKPQTRTPEPQTPRWMEIGPKVLCLGFGVQGFGVEALGFRA